MIGFKSSQKMPKLPLPEYELLEGMSEHTPNPLADGNKAPACMWNSWRSAMNLVPRSTSLMPMDLVYFSTPTNIHSSLWMDEVFVLSREHCGRIQTVQNEKTKSTNSCTKRQQYSSTWGRTTGEVSAGAAQRRPLGNVNSMNSQN